MSHGAAACASKVTHIGRPLPAVATDSAAARQMARRAMGAREKWVTPIDKRNTADDASANRTGRDAADTRLIRAVAAPGGATGSTVPESPRGSGSVMSQ